MTPFLTTLLRLSLFGSLLALALFALKPLLRGRVSRTVSYYLWLLVLLRLCIPAGLTLSLPASPVAVPAPAAVQVPETAVPVTAPPEAPPPSAPAKPLPVLPLLWAAGALLFAGWYLLGYVRLTRAVARTALPPEGEALALLGRLDPEGRVHLVQSSAVDTPLLLGIFRPTIVLPSRWMDPEQLRDILAHELTHARRYDLLYKWFAALTVSAHWFNPLMILVRREISRACELACDEAVIKTLDAPARQHYGETLLSLAACAPHALALPMCGEKRNLKERLVSIVKLHQRTPLAILLSAALVLAIGGCALVQDAAHREDLPPEVRNMETGETITFGMTMEEVGAILKDDSDLTWEELRHDLTSSGKKTYICVYHSEDGKDGLVAQYVDNSVVAFQAIAERPSSRWSTTNDLPCGSSLDEVKAKFKGYDMDASRYEEDPESWYCDVTFSDYHLDLWGNDASGLTSISVDPIRECKEATLSSDTYTRDTPGFVGVENWAFNGEEKPCVTLGMTPEEIGKRLGYGTYKWIVPEPPLTYYDYYGAVLVGYQEGKAVQMFATEGYFYKGGRDYTEPLPVTSTRGITSGSTLDEVLKAYPEGRIGEEVAPLWFGLDTAKKCVAVNVQGDGYTLTFWMKGTGVYDTVFAMGLTADGVPFPDMKGALPS